MNILRFLRTECIELNLDVELSEAIDGESAAQLRKRHERDKAQVLDKLVTIYERSTVVINRNKFLKDLDHRERKATTGIAPGIAIPHVRTLQIRSFVMGFVRTSGDGVPYLSLDGSPTRLFFLLASPPYDDRVYHQIYKELAGLLLEDDFTNALSAAADAQAVYQIFRQQWTA